MLKGITENGEMKNLKLTDNGELKVVLGGSTEEGVAVTTTADKEVVLVSSVLTVGITATTVQVGKKVTYIMVANYSETSDVTIGIGAKNYQVGANLAVELPVNLEVTSLSITATEADTKIQLVVKGVE